MHIVMPRKTIKKITSKTDDTKRYANIQKTNSKEREESTTTYIIALNVNQLNTYTVFSHIVSLDKTKFNYMLLTRDTLDSKTQIN